MNTVEALKEISNQLYKLLEIIEDDNLYLACYRIGCIDTKLDEVIKSIKQKYEYDPNPRNDN